MGDDGYVWIVGWTGWGMREERKRGREESCGEKPRKQCNNEYEIFEKLMAFIPYIHSRGVVDQLTHRPKAQHHRQNRGEK
ncbi:MAG: hypothetical protein M1827_003817 [Pycnora praestabilis]|nr:MAG: hypothetical protein M1827_003817 [Pycnora praestabilis]